MGKLGAGIRAAQNLILAGKVRALLLGRYNVSYGDVRALVPSVLRHRILLNFHAEAERVTTDDVIQRLLEAVPELEEAPFLNPNTLSTAPIKEMLNLNIKY